MPRKYFKKKSYKKKKYSYGRKKFYRRRKRTGPTQIKIRSPTGVPDTTKLEMIYSEPFTGSMSTSPYKLVFSGGSIYDPKATTGGGQPYSYDQWSQFYTRYLVRGSKITIDIVVDKACEIVLVPIVNTSNVPVSLNLARELPRAKAAFINQYKPLRMRHYQTVWQAFGSKSIGTDDHEFCGLMGDLGTGADPNEQFFWHMYALNPNLETVNIQARVTMKYYVTLFERQNLGSS